MRPFLEIMFLKKFLEKIAFFEKKSRNSKIKFKIQIRGILILWVF
jgi:hypothetical protein